jgi:hypothetical protein
MKNVLIVMSGNARTFNICVNTIYYYVVSKLFVKDRSEYNIYAYYYLKLTDPGPKGQPGWDFIYKDNTKELILNAINYVSKKYNIKSESNVIFTNEISDEELLSQVKDRSKYTSHIYGNDSFLLRGLHCHYNLEQCGKYILNKEKQENIVFDTIIYLRPDLYFNESCDSINTYSKDKITVGNGPDLYPWNNDHIAIIPRNQLYSFFFGRMKLYRENTSICYNRPEDVYLTTIDYEIKQIGHYIIKRP